MRKGLEHIINQIPIINGDQKQMLISEILTNSLSLHTVHAELDKLRQYLKLLSATTNSKDVKIIIRDLRYNIENAGDLFDVHIDNFECNECAFRKIDFEHYREHNDPDGEYILEYENACLECVECGNAHQQAWNSACSALFS